MRATRRSLSVALASGLTLSACARLGSLRSATSPEAQTRQGRVRGFTRNGASIFLGMPYGADTSGARRFLPPAPPASWTGVRDATTFGQRAPQPPPGKLSGSAIGAYFTGGRTEELESFADPMGEDCLVLNVVTPSADRKRRPVLFYIHGGGFTTGSGRVMTLGDRFTVREDVVLVTINHRLGALGFLYLGGIDSRYAAGNPGMLDLVAALEWVRDNIEAFGGDPDKVTIFGESGGGAKISLLMAMPQAKGLFRAAIIESAVFPKLQSPETSTAGTRSIMDKAGAGTLRAMQAIPPEQFPMVEWPTADGVTLHSDFWTTAPSSAANVPLIIGYCRDEETIFSAGNPLLFALDGEGLRTQLALKTSIPSAELDTIVDAYRAAFPTDRPSDTFFRISSELRFGSAAVRIADLKSQQTPPVYFYRMEYDTKIAPGLRSFHTAELPLTVGLAWQPEAVALSNQISGAWAAFARKLSPNHAGLPDWGRYDPASHLCMLFDLKARCIADPQVGLRRKVLQALR